MADTPEQTPAPGSTPASGEEQQASAKGKGGGLMSYLPLAAVIVLMPVLAWAVMKFTSRSDHGSAAAPATEHAESSKEEAPKKAESGEGHGSSKEKTARRTKSGRNTRLPIPLTRDAVAYHSKDPSKEGDYDKIVVLDLKGEPRDEAKSDKIIVNIAGTGGTRFAVARISLVGEREDLLERVNQNRERMLDLASGVLSMKTLDDVEKVGFRNILRAELLAAFNQEAILGRGTLLEVIITEFVIQ
ncbi:MAG: flagellar basal body-associated FliL family protein [Verrucomicrobia bacterium]|nr:flagellar basal body-associated FliL family protein [Verrucomicrobiota bacterium]